MARTKAQIKAKAIATIKKEQNYAELKDVVDVRTGKYHSVAIAKETKYFVPVEEYTE